jgi:hypothetical protein
VSAGGLLYTHSSKKRELLVKIYDSLLDADRQRGRQLLFEWCENAAPQGSWPSQDMRTANHAMSWLEVMSYLHNKRYIPQRDSFAIWGVTAVRTFKAAEQSGFIAFRDAQHGQTLWPQLRKFILAAEAKGIVGTAPQPINSRTT